MMLLLLRLPLHDDNSLHVSFFQVVFSDEITFLVSDNRARMNPGEDFIGQKIKVWGAFSTHGTGYLKIFKEKLSQFERIYVLQNNLLPQAREWFGGMPWIFQINTIYSNNDRMVKEWCRENKVKILKWPVASQNINPIQGLWSILLDELHEVPIRSKGALIERLQYVWFNSDKIRHFCKKLAIDMPERIKKLKAGDGWVN